MAVNPGKARFAARPAATPSRRVAVCIGPDYGDEVLKVYDRKSLM